MTSTELTKGDIMRSIKVLEKRRNWLSQRIEASDKDLSYDKAERLAINIALQTLRDAGSRYETE